MLNLLVLPLVGLLLAFPGLPSWSSLKKLRQKPAAPLDSLPPPWISAYRLAIQDSLVLAQLPPLWPEVGLKLNQDPRRLRVLFDPDSGMLSTVPEMGTVPVGASPRMSLEEYNHELTRRNFRRLWRERSRLGVNTLPGGETPSSSTSGLRFEVPYQLPGIYRSLLGPGGPALSVSGSENIRLSGTSEWTNQQVGLLGQRRSLFPSLDMQQDLDIRLEGQLSDRVKVNLLQNSANQIPLANRIAINYKGDEDDLVQSLDLGNTNLTLPGTQYVSYSGKNEGLFGMKATTRFGPLDFTVLASKQEGRSERASYSGGSARQDREIRDQEYVKGQYFFLYDPNVDAPSATEPRRRFIDESSLNVYFDQGGNYGDQLNLIRGRAFLDPNAADTNSVRGNFRLLTPGASGDYEILDNYGPHFLVLRLRTPITPGSEQKLATIYRYKNVDAAGNATGDSVRVGSGVFDTNNSDGRPELPMQLLRVRVNTRPDGSFAPADSTNPFARVRDLELKNFYQLPGQGIDPKTFVVQIRRGTDVPRDYDSPVGGASVPYLEILGLDNLDESTDPAQRGHDNAIDVKTSDPTFKQFVDFADGVLFFYETRPFAPDSTPFGAFINRVLNRRATLTLGDPDRVPNPIVYEKANPTSDDTRYWIDVSFTGTGTGSEITLGRSNIIEGSDVVTFNGQPLVRDKDYRIDYDLGRVTLIRQPGPTDQVAVDYAYAPLFQQAGKTLLGSSFRYEGREKSFGGAFLYESKGAQDLRPRIGEEPSRTLIGDLNTDWRFRPEWITRWIDALPGVRTTAGSEMSVSAEMGLSLPNPNTRNEVFIDDMEGVRDAVSLSMGPERWRWSSVPLLTPTSRLLTIEDSGKRNAEVHWFTPLNAVKERELKPSLTNAQGAQNSRQVLAISVPRRPSPPYAQPGDSLWIGLTHPLDANGIDLTRSQFIEMWVNDFRVDGPGRANRFKLHIDLGTVSEDQKRAPNIPPDSTLNSEDRNEDDELTVTGGLDEDTGVDTLKSVAEPPTPAPDLVTVSSNDPHGDDFELPSRDFTDLDPRKWVRTNGLEGNKNVTPIPDTEDLNLNDNLDTENDYFEYTIDLGDVVSPYLVTDVFESFQAQGYQNTDPPEPIEPWNGWRRYRIPINDVARKTFGSPNLLFTRHVRLWVEDVFNTDYVYTHNSANPPEMRPVLLLGGVDIVGSRWLASRDTAAFVDGGTTFTLNTVNTIDNADIYTPPFDPGRTRSGSQELQRREQSLAFEFTQFGPGDTLEAFKTFSIDENYSRYGQLHWYTASFEVPGYDASVDTTIRSYVRFASDEAGLNYYEISTPLPPSSVRGAIQWRDQALKLSDISNLKLNADFPQTGEIFYRHAGVHPGEEYVIQGRPSFTRIRRVSAGLMNGSGVTLTTGQVWVDELRATDVAKDVDRAQRVGVTGRMANLLTYTLNWNDRGADFVTVGETRGSGNSNSSINFGTTFDLHRFFEATGIVLPITFSYAGNRSVPRFTAGDDVVRTGQLADASVAQSINRGWSTSYARSWSERANPFLRYTIGGVTASFSHIETESNSPAFVNSSAAMSAGVNYSISPRKLLPLPLPLTKLKLFPLPERFFWNYGLGTSRVKSYNRDRDSAATLRLVADTRGRAAAVDFGADTRPFDLFHHQFSAHRNLSLPEPLLERVGFLNFGRVTSWRQSMDARYSVLKWSTWLRPNLSWSSNYTQNNGPELSPDLSARAITNGQNMSVTWDFPFNTLASRTNPTPAVVVRPTAPDTGKAVTPAPAVAKPRGPAGWRTFLARLGPVSTDASFDKNSSYTRLAGSPDFFYLTGVTSDPGVDSAGRMQPLFGNRSDDNFNWRVGGRTTVDLGFGASLQTRGNFNARRTNANTVITRENRSEFPYIEVRYGRIADVIGLKKLLVNPQLSTIYSRSQTISFANSALATGISDQSSWQPLLRLQGELKNGTRTELRVERRVTKSENRQNGRAITTDRNTDINLSVNRSYTQGQKVSFLGKESTVRSSVDLGLTAVFSRRAGETIQAGRSLPQNVIETDRLSVNGRGAYGFSNNVTGNLELGFSQNRDLQRDLITRSLRIELRANFTF